MLRRCLLVLCVALVGLSGFSLPTGEARPLPPCSVSISSATGSTGQISVQGDYVLGSGFTINGITIEVRPAGCSSGEGGQTAASITMSNFTFSGTVAVPAGTYYYSATLDCRDILKSVHYLPARAGGCHDP
jgi:hypothetical protein